MQDKTETKQPIIKEYVYEYINAKTGKTMIVKVKKPFKDIKNNKKVYN